MRLREWIAPAAREEARSGRIQGEAQVGAGGRTHAHLANALAEGDRASARLTLVCCTNSSGSLQVARSRFSTRSGQRPPDACPARGQPTARGPPERTGGEAPAEEGDAGARRGACQEYPRREPRAQGGGGASSHQQHLLLQVGRLDQQGGSAPPSPSIARASPLSVRSGGPRARSHPAGHPPGLAVLSPHQLQLLVAQVVDRAPRRGDIPGSPNKTCAYVLGVGWVDCMCGLIDQCEIGAQS